MKFLYTLSNLTVATVLLLVFLGITPPLTAGDLPGEAKVHEGMPYRIHLPNAYASGGEFPLVLTLHGAGGRGSNNRGNVQGNEAFQRLTTEEVQSEHPSIVLAPQCPNGQKWVDLSWDTGPFHMAEKSTTKSMQTAFDLFKNVMNTYRVNKRRVYVAGQSMGGYGTWYAVAKHPTWFAAAVPISGGGPPKHAKQMKDVSFWVFHGARDTKVPVDGSRAMVNALRDVNANVRYTELPETGHDAWSTAWNDRYEELIPWLFSQKKE